MFIVFEIVVNIVEALLFWVLLRVCVGYDENRKTLARTGWLIIALATTLVSNVISMPTFASNVILTSIEVTYAGYCFNRTNTIRFLYAFSLLVFAPVAEQIALAILRLNSSFELSLITQPSSFRIQGMALYLVILTVLFSLTMFLRPKDISFTFRQIALIAFLLIVNGTVITTMGFFMIENADIIPSLLPCSMISFGMIVVTVFVVLLFYNLALTSHEKNEAMSKLQQIRQDQVRFEQMEATIEILRGIKHDTNHHLRIIKGMIEEKPAQAIAYIDSLVSDGAKPLMSVNTGNIAIDALISEYAVRAKRNNIDFQPVVIIKDKMSVAITDLCSIISNLLENALEACCKLPDDSNRYIKVKIVLAYNNALKIHIINSSDGNYSIKNGIFFTRKSDRLNHGIGTKRIIELMKKNNGFISFFPEKTYFEAVGLLPIGGINE